MVLRTHPQGSAGPVAGRLVSFEPTMSGYWFNLPQFLQEAEKPLPSSSHPKKRLLVAPLSPLALCSKQITSTCIVNYF